MSNSVVFEFAGRKILFPETGHSLYLNAQIGGQAFPVYGLSAGRGLFNAFVNAFKQEKYPVLEVGLHLKKSEADLARLGFANDVGYLTAEYAGTNEDLLALRPLTGVVHLGRMGGKYVAIARIPEAPTATPFAGEPDSVTFARRVYWKHVGLDALLNNEKFMVSPTFADASSTPEQFKRELDNSSLKAWIANKIDICSKSNEQNQIDFVARMQGKRVNRLMAQGYAAKERGELIGSGITSVTLADGSQLPAMNLIGHEIEYVASGGPIGGWRTVTEQNLGVCLDAIKKLGCTVRFRTEATA